MPESRKVFHEELAELDNDVMRFGAITLKSIHDELYDLVSGSLPLGKRATFDRSIAETLATGIKGRVSHLLACQQPMAIDLRMLVTTMYVVHELEGIIDLTSDIAKAACWLHPRQLDALTRNIIGAMQDQAATQLQIGLDAFHDRDPLPMKGLASRCKAVENLEDQLLRSMVGLPVEETTLHFAIQLAFIGKNIRHIAKHAASIGRHVSHMVAGNLPRLEYEPDGVSYRCTPSRG